MSVLPPPLDHDVGVAVLPAENQYGHTKKLRFIRAAIAAHRQRLGRDVSVLDFGCGNGAAVSRYLIGPGVDFTGVDMHLPSLTHAREHFATERARFLEQVPDDGRFDVIVYADVLEHLDDPAQMLREHRARLAPDGIVVGAVPNGRGPFELESALDRTLELSRGLAAVSRFKRRLQGRPSAPAGMELPYNHDSGHVVFFTRASLARVAAEAGLRVTRFAHGAFVGGSVSGIVLARSPRLLAWNTRAADRLPSWAVSTWYFELQPTDTRA